MKLVELFESSKWKENLVDDAHDLANGDRDYIGTIKLVPDFQKKLTPAILKQYKEKCNQIYWMFDDPEGDDEEELVDMRYELAMKMLIANKLATKLK